MRWRRLPCEVQTNRQGDDGLERMLKKMSAAILLACRTDVSRPSERDEAENDEHALCENVARSHVSIRRLDCAAQFNLTHSTNRPWAALLLPL